jgi:uncharacterized OB-fold protein
VSDATRPEPITTEASDPFWEATRADRLVVQWCTACDRAVFFPRAVCPACLGDELEWRPSVGTGRVYAVTVEHRPQDPRLASRAPYAVALVDVDDGWRMLTNIVDCDPAEVAVGLAVEVTFEPLTDGTKLPMFRPMGESDA